MKVFLDAGHGGSDTGAVANGIIEKTINLIVATKVKQLLALAGIEVKISRTTDTDIGLSDRCKMANEWGADYFVSIHHNAGMGDGYEVIHSIYGGKGKELAEAVGRSFDKTGQNKRRIFSRQGKNGDYYAVIRESNMPAIITEFAFLDTNDYKEVDTLEELEREAKAMADGICDYLGIVPVLSLLTAENAIDIIDSKINLKGLDIDSQYWKSVYKATPNLDYLLIKIAQAFGGGI